VIAGTGVRLARRNASGLIPIVIPAVITLSIGGLSFPSRACLVGNDAPQPAHRLADPHAMRLVLLQVAGLFATLSMLGVRGGAAFISNIQRGTVANATAHADLPPGMVDAPATGADGVR